MKSNLTNEICHLHRCSINVSERLLRFIVIDGDLTAVIILDKVMLQITSTKLPINLSYLISILIKVNDSY